MTYPQLSRATQEWGADASTADNDGRTPVFKAAEQGHTGTVRLLMQELQECGADASTADMNGVTPVFKTAQNDHTETGAGAGVRRRRQHCQQE